MYDSSTFNIDIMRSETLFHLLQLSSSLLPIGAYSYSQGLEVAIVNGIVNDEISAFNWIQDAIHSIIEHFEAPILWRLLKAFKDRNTALITLWIKYFLAARDTTEFYAETIQMGYSLSKLALDLHLGDIKLLAFLKSQIEIPLPAAWAYFAMALNIPNTAALLSMLFSWIENQILVCVKSIPLGQVAGQRLLLSLKPAVNLVAYNVPKIKDEELSNWSPALSLMSMQHEVQYCRLYRS